MFRRFFRIGFGGCGCALEEHFRDHAAELSYNLLRKFYWEKLKKWTDQLPREPFETTRVGTISDLIISPEDGKKEGNYAGKFFEKLNNIQDELERWKGSLDGARGTVMSYEGAIIDVLIQNVTKMKDEAESIDKRGSVLLESLPVDSFTDTEAKGKSKRFYVYNQNITETRELIVDQFGQVVIESQGFNHQPELQMLPFSIKEVRDEVFKNITGTIEMRRLKDSATGGYLFFVGLGGGTGTGVISPLAEKFGKGSLGYFAVAVLGGKDDDKVLVSQQGWFRRCFNMLIALNDLIVTAELDGIILVDNDVIMKEIQKKGKSGPDLMAEIDEKIIEKLYPAFGITVLDGNDLDWSQLKEPIGLHNLKKKPPVIVPCYASGVCSKSEDNLEHLIEEALNNGKLAPCEDLEKAERVFVYVRCIKDEKTLRKKLAEKFAPDEVKSEEKLAEKFATDEIAILKDYLFCWDDVKEGYFSLQSECRQHLKEGPVSNELSKAFEDNQQPLTSNARLTRRDEKKWTITDGMKEYRIKDTGTELNIYKKDNDKELKSSLRNVCEIDWVDNAEPKGDHNGDKLELYNPSDKNEKIIIEIRERELFNWDDVVQQNDGELKKYLEDCNIEVDSISISNDKKTITISNKNKNKVATIKLIEEENKATLEWDNKGTKEKRALKVKKEKEKGKKEKRKLYSPPEAELFTGKYLFNWDNVQQNDGELKEYLEGCGIEFGSFSRSDDKITILDKNKKEVATITLIKGENKATLKLKRDNEKTRDLKVKDQGIYDYLRKNGNKKVEDPELKVETVKSKRTVKGKHYVYLKKCQTTRNWIRDKIKKRIVVFESQEIGSFWHDDEKKNEVLILLFNPDVKKALSDRLLEAKNFVDLLDKFKAVVEEHAEKSSEDKSTIAKEIVKRRINNDDLSRILDNFSKATKDITEEDKKPLPQAKDFLFPKELYDKDKGIYGRMVEILDRLKKEVGLIPEEGKDEDWWPIFRENIFDIISTSGKRDEVILSAIEALDDQNKFNKLVGEGVYNTYFQTFKRQYFKYNAPYLYPGVGEPILSDAAEQELPVALKDNINTASDRKKRITGDDLKVLVKNYTIEPVLLFSFSGDLTDEGIKKGFTDEGKKKKIELSNDCIFVEGKYWFTWEKVNGAEESIFRELLTNNCKLTWAKKAKIVMDANAKNKIVVSNEEESKYLFSWDNVPEDDNESENLLKFLTDELDIDWAKGAEIRNDDGKTIRIFKDENSAEIIIDDKKEKATLKIRDVEKTYDLKVKMDDGKLNLYELKNLELTIPDSGNCLTINSQELKIKTGGSNHYIYEENNGELTIIDGAKIYSAQENGGTIDVYSHTELSYPAMLAVAGLYAEWEQVGSLPYDSEGKDAICLNFFGKGLSSVDFEIYELPKESKINIPNNPQILIIDADKEDATLVIRKADKDLFQWVAKNNDEVSEWDNKKIPQSLKTQFKDEQGMATEDYDDLKETNEGQLKLQPNHKAITEKKLYRCYYIKENDDKLTPPDKTAESRKCSIDGDKIYNTLKVKKEEGKDGKTLKIYKKRGDKFEVAE